MGLRSWLSQRSACGRAPAPNRLGYVTQWYAPEPFHTPEWTVRALAARGWDVTVLTGVPNYPDGVVQPGYSARRLSREVLGGQTVIRAPLFPSHDRSALRRTLNYVSWAVSASVVGARMLRRSAVNYVYSSPATAALPALVARVLGRRPYVLSVQDVWPDSVFASGFLTEGPLRRVAEGFLSWFVGLTYRWAHHVVVISPGMRALLHDRGVPADKISLVYNWVDETVFKPSEPDPAFRQRLGLEPGDFAVVYAGNHGAAQGLRTAIEAVTSLPPDLRVHLVLIGDGVEKEALRAYAVRLGAERIHFVGSMPTHQIPATTASCEIQLVSLVDDPLFKLTMPSKVQAIMAMGQPVLASAPGDAARLVQESGAGFAVAPSSPSALAESISMASRLTRAELRRMGDNGRRRYLEQMSADVGSAALDQILQAAVSVSGHPQRRASPPACAPTDVRR